MTFGRCFLSLIFSPLQRERKEGAGYLEREIRSADVEVQQVWRLYSVHIDDDNSERTTLLCAVCAEIKRLLLPFDISQSLVSRGSSFLQNFQNFQKLCALRRQKPLVISDLSASPPPQACKPHLKTYNDREEREMTPRLLKAGI